MPDLSVTVRVIGVACDYRREFGPLTYAHTMDSDMATELQNLYRIQGEFMYVLRARVRECVTYVCFSVGATRIES